MIVRLKDIPKLSSGKFQPDNSCMWLHVPTPAHLDLASGFIKVDDDYWIVGWCNEMDDRLMCGREGQVGLMFFSDADGEVWEHYPLYGDLGDGDSDYDYAKFDTKRGVLAQGANHDAK